MLHCLSSMSRNNTENWFEHNKATVTGMTRVDSQCNTTGDCACPGNLPPDFHPQDSSCKTAEIRLAGAWTFNMATALLQRFPWWRSFTCTKLHSERPEVTLVLPPLHLSKAEQHTMLRCQEGTDTHKHWRPQSCLGWTGGRPPHTYLVQRGLHTVIKKDGGLLHICQ